MRRFLLFVFALVTGLPSRAQEPAAPKAPVRLVQPSQGSDVVSGKSDDHAWPVRVKVFDGAGSLVQQRDVLVDRSDSTIVAGFSNKLQSGQIVQACFLVGAMEVMPSVPLVVTAAAHVSTGTPPDRALPQTSPVRIRGELEPGADNVIVDATPTPPNSGYDVHIYSCPGAVPAGIRDSTGFKPYAVTDATGQASITFEKPLAAGQSVSLCQKIVDSRNAAAPAIDAPGSGVIAIANPLDLGRVRYYFTAGVVLSNDQEFQLNAPGTKAALFLGLDADRAWLPLDTKGVRRLNVNTYLDARLTSVPTQQTAAGSGITVSSTLQGFTESQKAATFETGAYLPLIAGQPWSSGNGTYSLFLAPLAKAGFTTLANDATPNQTLPVTNRFFKSYAYGTRLGVFQHFRSETAAPELISFIDFTVGRFGDFEAFRDLTLEQNPNASLTEPHDFLRLRPWRYSLEGLFKVPHSPFVLGFSANVGTGATPAVKGALGTFPFTEARDDLRFLFGAQFDFSKFLKAIPEF